MDYINLINECPITYVEGSWWAAYGKHPGPLDDEGMTWELYDPWGEIRAFSTRSAAEKARAASLCDYLS